MRTYAEAIGDPVAHSRSPLIHRFWCEAVGIEADYRATRVCFDELAGYFTNRRSDPLWKGCNLTAPLKEVAAPLLDRLSGEAMATGAVNCVIPCKGQLIGHNSDVDGIAEALASAKIVDRPVAVIGAGGAARATVRHLAQSRPSIIRLVVRDPDRARSLAALVPPTIALELYRFSDAAAAFEGAVLAVNATPLGLSGVDLMPDCVITALGALADGATVMDMVYDPLETPLLRAGREHDLCAIDGLVMLIGQADASFRRFFGAIPVRHKDSELLSLLRASLALDAIYAKNTYAEGIDPIALRRIMER